MILSSAADCLHAFSTAPAGETLIRANLPEGRMLRPALLAASRSARLRAFVTGFPVARRVSRRFVAGETLDEALSAAKRLNDEGLLASLDHLGESVSTAAEAEDACDAYLLALDSIREQGLKANISVKLTQLGLDSDTALCESLTRRLALRALKSRTSVTIDMEDSVHTERTLELYRRLRAVHRNLGTVIQSYLYRSEEDLRGLIALGAGVRLCKGAYNEPASVAYPDKGDVDRSYMRLTEMLFSEDALKKGAYPCIATHDERMILGALRIVQSRKIDPRKFEFQMLYGIRQDLQRKLAEQGYQVRVYTPYGPHWYPYFMRRLAERPANLWFFLRSAAR